MESGVGYSLCIAADSRVLLSWHILPGFYLQMPTVTMSSSAKNLRISQFPEVNKGSQLGGRSEELG